MEAKDTVMKNEQIAKALEKQILFKGVPYGRFPAYAPSAAVDEGDILIAKAQAKSTWHIAHRDGELAGIRKVLDWMEAHREGGYNLCVKASLDEWRSQLEKWEKTEQESKEVV